MNDGSFYLQLVSVMVRPVKMAARAAYQREELLTAYACPGTVEEHALVNVAPSYSKQ